MSAVRGPLAGVRILEIGGIGPVPHFGMLCADMGASIVRIDRAGSAGAAELESSTWMFRGRKSMVMDLKAPGAAEVIFRLCTQVDVLVEGFRPGVAERLGIGPDDCRKRAPGLIYGRMTGWGGFGPYADMAGHDINYIAMAGALGTIGPAGQPPTVPLNLVGDYGGGSMMLLAGVLAALVAKQRTGDGQVVEVAMVDGAISLMAQHFADRADGKWQGPRGGNFLDGGAPFYSVYESRDGRYVAVGAGEPKFYQALIETLELDPEWLGEQFNMERWPELRLQIARAFATRSRSDWEEAFRGVDACFTPVLTMDEVAHHPHHQGRQTFGEIDGHFQPRPPWRFSATTASWATPRQPLGSDTESVLASCGCSEDEIRQLRSSGVIGSPQRPG
jgi:alpha-methylacyl-CoA racemase